MSHRNSLFLMELSFVSNHLRIKDKVIPSNIHIQNRESSGGGRDVQEEEGTSMWIKSSWVLVLGLNWAWYLMAPWILPWLLTTTRLTASAHRLGLLERMLRSWALCSLWCDSSRGHLPALQGWGSFNPGLLHCAPGGSIFKENKVTDVPGCSTRPQLWLNLSELLFPSLWSRENNRT